MSSQRPYDVIRVADTGLLYDGVIPVLLFLSSQCPDTGIQFHLMMVSCK
ncbi:hypothetical protein [Wolbachia endosymbiont (group A) of Agelastica alni]